MKTVLALLCLCAAALAGTQTPGREARLAALEQQARSALAREGPAAALRLLEDGLRLDPEWKAGLWSAGLLQYQSGDYPAARSMMERLVKSDARHGAYFGLLGVCEFEMRDYALAAEHLDRARLLGVPASTGLDSAIRFQEALAQVLARRFDIALYLLHDFADLNPPREELYLALGAAALELPVLPADARGVLSPRRFEIVVKVGEAEYLGRKREYAGVDRIYADLFARFPQARWIHSRYAFHLGVQGQWEAAKAEHQREVALDPQSAVGWLGVAESALELNRLSEGLEAVRQAIAVAPWSFRARLCAGRILIHLGRFREAVAGLEAARRLEPSSSAVRYALATAYRENGALDRSKTEMAEFLRLKKLEKQRWINPRGSAESAGR